MGFPVFILKKTLIKNIVFKLSYYSFDIKLYEEKQLERT